MVSKTSGTKNQKTSYQNSTKKLNRMSDKNNEVENEIDVIIKLWKKKKVDYCTMEFSCGGDSMNETSFTFYNSKGKEIKDVSDLHNFFEDEVYNRVEFYECSDGHYQGEFGTVTITLQGNDFVYDKSSQSEFYERHTEEVEVEISEEEYGFLNEYVSEMRWSSDDGYTVIWKKDFLLTEEQDKMMGEIRDRIENGVCSDMEVPGESDENYGYQTEIEGVKLNFTKDKTAIIVLGEVGYYNHVDSND